MHTRFATLAYGENEAVFRQATMLVVSLAAFAPPGEVLILTDSPGRFEWLSSAVTVQQLAPSRLAAWRQADPFSMREKIEAARALLPPAGALLLLDADTLARQPLAPLVGALHGGSLFMHKREYVLSATRRSGNRRLWDDLRGRAFGDWEFRPTDAMWNSGVIALTHRDAPLLDSALRLYDALGAAGVRHFMVEQLAVGVVLDRTGRLSPATDCVAHYWGNKRGFDVEISKWIERVKAHSWSLQDAAAAYLEAPINLPVEVRPGPLRKLAAWFGG